MRAYGKKFEETADPQYVHKIAVILDQVADTYYGLPLCDHNELAKGKDGKPLTRAEWEAVPRPAIFEVSYLGGWSRRLPGGSRGWLNMMDVFVLPSLVDEGVPQAMSQAMASGLPVVTTPSGAITELVREGETGLFTPRGHAAALAAAIKRDQLLRRHVGQSSADNGRGPAGTSTRDVKIEN